MRFSSVQLFSRVAVGACILLLSSVCWAGATLTLGFGSDSDCNTADNCSGSPNVGGESFSIHSESGGQDIPAPILLILGVPDIGTPSLFSADSIMSMSVWDQFDPNNSTNNKSDCPGCWSYGTADFGLGSFLQGSSYTAASGGSVYDFLNLSGASGSSHFGNWHGFLLNEHGVNVSSFGIYVFALNATLAGKGLIEVAFQNTVPDFTYMVGYGQSSKGANTMVFSTPFTRSALKVSVPEPSFGLLLGVDMLFVALGVIVLSYRARLRRKSQPPEQAFH